MYGDVIFLTSIPFILLIIFCIMAEKGRQKGLIYRFCNDLQFYNFETRWKQAAIDVYNSFNIGETTLEDARKAFEDAKSQLTPIDKIESFSEAPAFLIDKYKITKGSDYIQQYKEDFEQSLSDSIKRLNNSLDAIKPLLVSEKKLPSGIIITVYKWSLMLDYVTSEYNGKSIGETSGGAITFAPQTNGNGGGNAYTAIDATTVNYIHSTTTEKAYIELTFEDGKMTGRRQKGLFEV